jgi:RNA polymerase sigma-54 factor
VSSTSAPALGSSREVNLEDVYQVTESLQDHLLWQLNLTPFSVRDKNIAVAFIDAINENGFITEDLHDAVSHLNGQYQDDLIETDELSAVLKRLQQFDPPGIFARDLQECLMIQLDQLDSTTPYLSQAKILVKDHLNEIASVELSKLSRKSNMYPESIQNAINLIRTLNPHPGEQLNSNNAEYVVPDVFIEKISGSWQVRLNDSNIPRLRINNTYADLIKRSDNSSENLYLKNNLAEARWFLRSLESRNESLMRVAVAIVDFQQGFLNHGPVAMKPMVLSDIAQQLNLHESTISRVTTKKYIATPQGIFELKYFFSSHVGTSAGGECSSTAVCAILKELIAAENPAKPLSDNKIATLLADKGIQVARRTVAKYRESINIPSSSQRKRFANGI